MGTTNSSFDANSDAVRKHLDILQDVIRRMASNSASCKTWCITLVSAILVLAGNKDNANYAPIAFLPALLFFFLDTYYLALEKQFRDSYNTFVGDLHKSGTVPLASLYRVVPQGSLTTALWNSVASFAIWPFYLPLVVVIGLLKGVVLTGAAAS